MSESHEILLARWLSGEINQAELEELKLHYDLNVLHTLLEKQAEFEPATMDEASMWKGFEEKREIAKVVKKEKSHLWKYFLLGIMALFALIFFFLWTTSAHIETKNQKLNPAQFADGSEMIIGPHSVVKYNEKLWKEERKIKLNGQAFFKVEKGVPFIVETQAGSIEVLGTSFDVWSIDPQFARVSCTEGKVQVNDNKGASKVIGALEQVYIVNGKIQEIERVESVESEWMEDFRNYRTTPLKIVLKDLERFYQKSIEANPSIQNDVFSGVLPINDLDKCIRFLETSLRYESEEKNNGIMLRKAK